MSWVYYILTFYGILPNYDMRPNIVSVEIVVLVLFSYGVWIGSDLFIKRIPMREFMAHSFWVYALHENVSAVITKVLYLLLPKQELFSVVNFSCTIIISLIVIEVFCKLTFRFLPRVALTLQGGR